MKKRVIFLTLIGSLILIIAGIFGAWYSYYKISTDVKIQHRQSSTTFTEQDLRNVQLNLTGGSSVTIEPSPDNQFHLYEKSFRKHPKIPTWSVRKEEANLVVDIQHASRKKLKFVPFMPLRIHNLEETILQVPKHVQNLTIASDHVSTKVKDFTLSSLTATNTTGSSTFQSIAAATLKVENTQGDITLNTSKITDSTTFTSSSGSIIVDDSKVGTLETTTHTGTIGLYNASGDGNTKLETTSGDITLQDAAMKVSAQSNSGEISVSNASFHHDLDLETKNGFISIYASSYPQNFSIKTDAPSDSVYIFNEERSSYQTGDKTGITLTAKTSDGYITIDK